MALVRAQVSAALDTTLPRDRVVNVTHFNVRGAFATFGTDFQNLCNDLHDIFVNNWYSPPGSMEVITKMYNLDDPEPRAPKASRTTGAAVARSANVPREVALCLSFYAERNLPRSRGRIYLSPAALGSSSLSAKPTTTMMNQALAIADALSGLGGIDVDWCVFSRMDNSFKKVTNAYVDDEWDVQRRRGLRASNRVARAQSG
jgi:hypothetical protein